MTDKCTNAVKETTEPIAAVEGGGTAQILSLPLYQMSQEYLELMDAIADNNGELDEEMVARFTTLSGSVKEKIENCALMVQALETQRSPLADEIRRLQDRKKQVEKRQTWMKEYIHKNMIKLKIARSEGKMLNVRRQASGPKCTVVDEAKVPAEYSKTTVAMPTTHWRELQSAFGLVVAVVQKLGDEELTEDQRIDDSNKIGKELIAVLSLAMTGIKTHGTATTKASLSEITAAWKECAGAEDVPGTEVKKGESLVIW